MSDVDYGPLTGLIGQWKGDKGIDVAPNSKETERNPFHETILFEAAGDVENAESQTLAVIRYHQEVFRKSNDEQFHDQIGYFTWDAATETITHSFVIPRGVGIVSSGGVTDQDGSKIRMVMDTTDGDNAAYGVAQSTFMRDNASTTSYTMTLILDGDKLAYEQVTMLDIYKGEFKHLDKSTLTRV